VKRKLAVRVSNVTLRGLSMVSRFVLMIEIAKLLQPAEVGLFGLITAIIAFSVLIIGMEFHSHTMREINKTDSKKWSYIIQHHIIAQSILFCIFYPLALFIFKFSVLPIEYLFWFSEILFLEILNQEIHWFLIGMQKQIVSSIVMFIRTGLWVFIVIPFMNLNVDLNNITSLLFAWSVGSGLAVLVGGIFIWKIVPVWKAYRIDWHWIKNGGKVGLYFLLAALTTKGLFTIDRYSVEQLGSSSDVGVYVFYFSIVMGAFNFLEPAVFSFIYPKMIASYHKKNIKEYLSLFKELSISTFAVGLIIVSSIWFSMPYILEWVGKPVYGENYAVLGVLILLGFVYVLGMIPHYGLYAMGKDKWIIIAQVTSVIIYFSVIVLYKTSNAIMTVSLGLLFAFVWMATVKYLGYKISMKDSYLTKREAGL
jgi:O-antigen/teichoic acid export membrane protein